MKIILIHFLVAFFTTNTLSQTTDGTLKTDTMHNYEVLKTESHLSTLKIAITHKQPEVASQDYPVLFLHGASFPSGLAFAFPMSGYSWMDNLSENGYDVYALDFLGYGNSDRYPEMSSHSPIGKPLGRASEIYLDVDKAVDLILAKTGKKKVHLIAHSWGGSVASLYTTKFAHKIAKLILFASITPRQDTTTIETEEKLYNEITPEQRIAAMKSLTPEGKVCQLEPEIFNTWRDTWLQTDILATHFKYDYVRYPAGFTSDVDDLQHGRLFYDPAAITVPVLLIRGEWDKYPSNADEENLFALLQNSPSKKYVVIEKGTHVMHLERSRYQLYDETLHFLANGKDKRPIAVIFEVIPAKDQKDEYLNIAASLKPELEKIKGFISIERFQSIYNPEKILSLSFWENEEAIKEWRNLESHRMAQKKGREHIFKDYHLRITQVIRDYGMFDRERAPTDSRSYHH